MYIQAQPQDPCTIQAYSDTSVIINNTTYSRNLLITATTLITPWTITGIEQISLVELQPLIDDHISTFLIGHSHLGTMPQTSLITSLASQNIGFEWMSIAAACRTFNILISEKRTAALGIIFT